LTAWAIPSGDVSKIGTAYDNQVAVWTGDGIIEGTNDLMFDAGILLVNSQVTTQRINESNMGSGVRFPYKTQLGADTAPTATLDVLTSSGSNPSINVVNQGSGYALVLNAISAATAQQNIIADAATTTIIRGLDVVHTTSDTAAAGFGTGITLSTEYDSGVNQISGAIDAIITDATYATGDSRLSFKVNVSNSLVEVASLTSAGIFQVDIINELTALGGVTIEGVLLEDSDITIATANYLNLNAGGTTNVYDNAGVMTFTDTVTGPVTLAALATTTGDVIKVGTPVDNQVGVWTGDGTLEGDTELTYDDAVTTLYVGVPSAAPSIEINATATPGYSIYSDGYIFTYNMCILIRLLLGF